MPENGEFRQWGDHILICKIYSPLGFHRKQWGFYHLKTQSFPASLQLTLGHWNFLWVKNGQRKTSIYSKEVQAATLGCAFLDASHVVIKEITNPNCRTYGRAGTPSPKSKILNLDILINGNSRILKWRYFSTIVLAIFCFFPLPKKNYPAVSKSKLLNPHLGMFKISPGQVNIAAARRRALPRKRTMQHERPTSTGIQPWIDGL